MNDTVASDSVTTWVVGNRSTCGVKENARQADDYTGSETHSRRRPLSLDSNLNVGARALIEDSIR